MFGTICLRVTVIRPGCIGCIGCGEKLQLARDDQDNK
jgi:hypothetical protein